MSATRPEPRIEVTRGGRVTVARVTGCPDLTGTETGDIGRQLAGLAGTLSGQHLVVDLAGVQTLGDDALTRFLELSRGVKAAGGRLTLIGLSPHVCRVFAVTHVDTVLDVRPLLP
jgi:anti-anti-sigma factor